MVTPGNREHWHCDDRPGPGTYFNSEQQFLMLYSVPFMPRIIIDVGAGISSHYQEVWCIHPSSESFDGSHVDPYYTCNGYVCMSQRECLSLTYSQ